MSGMRLGRVSRDFTSESRGELSLSKDDVVQILSRVDRHWVNVLFNGSTGSFPSDYIVEVDNFTPPNPNPAFVAIDDFSPIEPGDLSFSRGNILEGIHQENDNWWTGRIIFDSKRNQVIQTDQVGIFPITHVYRVRMDDQITPETRDHQITPETMDDQTTPVTRDHQTAIGGQASVAEDDSLPSYESALRLSSEGSSNASQRINSSESTNSQFVNQGQPNSSHSNHYQEGVSSNHHQEGVSSNHHQEGVSNHYQEGVSNHYQEGVSNHYQEGVSSYGMTLFPFEGEFLNELTFKAGEVVHLIRYIDEEWIEGELNGNVGIFPRSFIQIVVDIPGHSDLIPGHSDLIPGHSSQVGGETTGAGDEGGLRVESSVEAEEELEYPGDTFARVISEFTGEVEGDLPLRPGTSITLIRRLGQDWVEAVDDEGRIGLCPLTFVEIIPSGQDDTVSLLDSSSSVQESATSVLLPLVTLDTCDDSVPPTASSQRPPSLGDTSGNQMVSTDTTMSDLSATGDSLDTNEFSLKNIVVHRSPPSRPAPPRLSAVTQGPADDGQEIMTEKPARPPRADRSTSVSSSSCVSGQPSDRNPPIDGSAEEREKRKVAETRAVTLTELLQTEKDYLSDLRVCMRAFEKGLASDHPDILALIGNLPEIISVNSSLNSSLERAIREGDPDTSVPSSFLSISPSMGKVYCVYCKNAEDLPVLWMNLSSSTDPQIRRIVRTANEMVLKETNCMDVPSLLIKPVQRILKYPLLLSELVKVAKDESERSQLNQALQVMIAMATEINEYKRRKDIISKYHQDRSQRSREVNSSYANILSDKLSRLNVHSINKKASRLGFKITTSFGLNSSSLIKDQKFDTLVLRYRSLEKMIKIFLSDIISWKEKSSHFNATSCNFIQSLLSFNGPKSINHSDMMKLRDIHEKILKDNWNDFIKSMDSHIVQVLNCLLSKFDTPNHLISKRNDKLIDFEAATKKVEKFSNPGNDPLRVKQAKDELSIAEVTYKALNDQLISDLPSLIKISSLILNSTIVAYFKMFKLFLGKNAEEIYAMIESPLLSCSSMNSNISSEDIQSTFQIKYNLIMSDFVKEFTLVPPANLIGTKGPVVNLDRNNSLRSSSSSNGSGSNQPKGATNQVKGTSHKNKRSEKAVVPSKRPSLSFFSSHKMAAQSGSSKSSSQVAATSSRPSVPSVKEKSSMGTIGRRSGLKDKPPQTTNQIESIHANYPSDSIYKVATDFTAHDQMDLPLRKGDVVGVIKRHNPMGNPNQWLVHDGLNKGFILAKYLEPCSGTSSEPCPLIVFDSPDGELISGKKGNGFDLNEFDPLASSSDLTSSSVVASDQTIDLAAASIPSPNLDTINDLYVAQYPFSGSGNGIIPLTFGQVVRVLRKSDLEGNSEWWKVQDKNNPTLCGFVPSNYLAPFKSS